MERTPITERFPQLNYLDGKDLDQTLEIYRSLLDALQHELDEHHG